LTKHDPIARRAVVAERDRSQTPPLGSAIDPRAAVETNQSEPSQDDFDHFDIAQLPTEARQQLIAAELPLVPKHQLFDTSPPNKPLVAASTKQRVASIETDDPPRLPIRSARKFVIAIVAVMLGLLGLALLGRNSTAPQPTTSASGSAEGRPLPTAQSSETLSTAQASPQLSAPAPKPAPALSEEQPERAPASKSPPLASRIKGVQAPKSAPSSTATDAQAGGILRTVIAPPDE